MNPFSLGAKVLLAAAPPEGVELTAVGFLGSSVASGKLGTLETVAADELGLGLTGFVFPGSAKPLPSDEGLAA